MISERTRAALAVRKGQGAQLGNRTNLAAAQATGAARTAAAALRFAENTAPVIKQVRASGITSLRGIARVLNTRGVRTARGGTWAATQVSAVLQRVAPDSLDGPTPLSSGSMKVPAFDCPAEALPMKVTPGTPAI